MSNLKKHWDRTKKLLKKHEQEIIDVYISFLRTVARYYLKKSKRVAFRENKVVHYGEGGFGSLVIEADENEFEVFGASVIEIRFAPDISEELQKRGYTKINPRNLTQIKYVLYG